MEKHLQRLLKWGVTLLVAVMPFHAFLAIWLGQIFGHQAVWQSWKELVVLAMALAAVWLLARQPGKLRQLFRQPANQLAVVFCLIALLISLAAGWPSRTAFIFGVKTDLVFVAVFILAQLAANRSMKLRLAKILLITSSAVSLLALIQAWLLPPGFLSRFGYGANTILPVQRLDPALPVVRTFATLGGPNQLGAFLILPICLVSYLLIRRFRWWQPAALLLFTVALITTYSRSAWIGATAAVLITLLAGLKPTHRRLAALVTGGALVIGLATILPRLATSQKLQYYLLHASTQKTGLAKSDEQHALALREGVTRVFSTPLGQGLGTAGPASKYAPRPFIPENYYLQIAVETGLVGLVLFLTWQIMVGRQLWRLRTEHGLAIPLLGTLVGIAIVNLFLHGWADSTLALVYWSLAGVVIGAGEAA